MDRRLVVGIGAASAIAICAGAYAYASPYLFPASVKRAALNGDYDRLEELVDFPRVRESLRISLTGILTKEAEEAFAGSEDNPLGAALATLATGMIRSLIGDIVDQAVTPQGLEKAVKGEPLPVGKADAPAVKKALPNNLSEKATVTSRYVSWKAFRYTVTTTEASKFDIDLRRQGLFGWKVVRVTPKLDWDALNKQAEKPTGKPQVASPAPVAPPASVTPASSADKGTDISLSGEVFDAYACVRPEDADFDQHPGCIHLSDTTVWLKSIDNQGVATIRYEGEDRYVLAPRVLVSCQGTPTSIASFSTRNGFDFSRCRG